MKAYLFTILVILSACAGKSDAQRDSKFKSQVGQDQFVYENFFRDKKEGIFVDIGAHNGVKFSNTHFFEKELGWRGICVEPIPEVFQALQDNRKNSICVQGCISNKTGKSQFLRLIGPSEMISGLVESYDQKHVDKIERQIARKGSKQLIEVDCFLFNDLLEQNGIHHVNFLSLDVEGSEYDILSSIDFSKFQIDVITVENNYHDPRFKELLCEKGFDLVKNLEQDMIFVHRNIKE